MSFVLDNSVAMTWCFEDEATAPTDDLYDRALAYGAYVPQIWPLEVVNTLLRAQFRGRIPADYRITQINRLYRLPIIRDEHSYDAAWIRVAELAERHRLTAYDAAYLELALRLQLPLATLDGDLRAAAAKESVELLGA